MAELAGAPEQPLEPSSPRYRTALGLFLATVATTTWAGANQVHAEVFAGSLSDALLRLADGLPFAASLLGILVAHEMGHYLAARYHRVPASLPYFIPIPFGMIGTFGAVIQMPDTVRNRNELVDIAAAGPIAGFIVAVPLLLYGLSLSPIEPPAPGQYIEGNSVLYLGLKWLITGRILPGGGLDVSLHPIALAGWVGLLVTMINLIPVGQLDGGHLAAAVLGRRHEAVSRWLHRGLLPLALAAGLYSAFEQSARLSWDLALQKGLPAGMPWAIWWIMVTLMRRMSSGDYHPPVDDSPLTAGRRRLCLAMLMLFLLILTPVPLRPAP